MSDTAELDLDGDVDGFDDDELIEQLRSAETQRRRLEAFQAARVLELERRKAYRTDGHASVHGLVRVVTKRTNWEISDLLHTARLMDAEASVADALTSGRLGVRQAHELARARAHPRCGDDLRGDELSDLLDEAVDGSYSSFHTRVRDWVSLHDQDGKNRDADVSHELRDAWFGFVGDDFHGQVQGAAIDGEAVMKVFERYVQAEWDKDWTWTIETYGPDHACEAKMPRTARQRRYDAFKSMVIDAASTPPDSQPPDPVVNIVTDSDTFVESLARFLNVDLDETVEPAAGSRRRRFCHTASGVPVSPNEMVAAALAGYVRRVVMNAQSVVVDMGRKQRLFTGELRTAAHMDRHRCCWPGCELPASKCHTDHLTPWSQGGCTCPEDGCPMCPRHNLFKSRRRYTNRRGRRGRIHTYRPDGTEVA